MILIFKQFGSDLHWFPHQVIWYSTCNYTIFDCFKLDPAEQNNIKHALTDRNDTKSKLHGITSPHSIFTSC